MLDPRNADATIAQTLAAASLVLMGLASAAIAAPEHNCALYATKAVHQQNQNLQLGCGFTDIGWSADYNAHFAWCQLPQVGIQQISQEDATREQAIVACQAPKQRGNLPDHGANLKKGKSIAPPPIPNLAKTTDLPSELRSQAKARNRAEILQYFQRYQDYLNAVEQRLKSSQFLEDLESLPAPREPAGLSGFQGLESAEQQYLARTLKTAQGQRDRILALWKQRSKELRTKRRPRDKAKTLQPR